MSATAFGRLVDALRDHGRTVKEAGDGKVMAQCPSHDDGRPSLSITRIDGSVLLYCHAGCQAPDVLGAVGLTPSDLFDDREGARYDYPDGRTVLRSADKRFSQRGNTKGDKLFHVDRINGAETVYVVEGEKDVLAVESAGGTAVCAAMGAGKAKMFDWSPLSGRRVIVVADRDEPGRKHAADVSVLLDGKVASLQVVESVVGKDAADHLAAGKSLDEFVGLDGDLPTLHDNHVQFELEQLRVRDEARRLHALETRAEAAAAIPLGITLTELLAQPDEDAAYRIDGLLPIGGRAVLAAQYKAGKSTMGANLIRSLVDGTPFLGHFSVTAKARVVLLDNELDERQLRRWLRHQGVVNTDAVKVHSLRGRVSSFDILNPDVRALWADLLRGADVVILDCLRPVLDALGLDENREAGQFLVAFDELLREAWVSEAILVHHMGHSGERSRGDSRLLDWPDVLWNVVRDKTDGEDGPEADRYFSAYGRDVDVREGKLDYTPETRSLFYLDTNRRESAGRSALPDIAEVLADAKDGLSGRALESALTGRGHTQKTAREAVKLALKDQLTYTANGARNAKLHHLNPSSALVRCSALPVRQHGESECVSASIETHSHSLRSEEGSVRCDALTSESICEVCGEPLMASESIARGYCEKCRLATSSDADR